MNSTLAALTWYAVRKPRPRVEAEDHVGTGIVGLDRLGDQAIECQRFIEGAQHQRLDYVADETLCRGIPHSGYKD